ncbi:hypothetical protein PUN28_015682 [Cardiocondyla obscurior]|uniref:Uncharacterized protein n=1 Tax=Cardiocondyla obscurior TaxID=286306 RepID=A0AAW2EWU3_9HYME
MMRLFERKLSCTERTAPLRSYGDTSRRIRKLNKHPIDALILRRGGIPRLIREGERKTVEKETIATSAEPSFGGYEGPVLAGLNEYCRRYPGVPNSTLHPPPLFECPLSLA